MFCVPFAVFPCGHIISVFFISATLTSPPIIITTAKSESESETTVKSETTPKSESETTVKTTENNTEKDDPCNVPRLIYVALNS